VLSVFIIFTRSLLSSIFAVSFYSMVCATIFFISDAVDVALTEAAVGAGISTLLFIKVLHNIDDTLPKKTARDLSSFILFFLLSIILISFSLNFPEFGLSSTTSDAPSTQYYLNESQVDIGIPNVVTSILAGYRAFDTLGEVLVIFIAGISVLGILREEKKNG